jgi:CRISPR-associated protein Csb2
MPSNFCLTIRFLQPYSHGRGEDGEPEWPPSPLRAFQSLVAAAAARWNERSKLEYAAPALQWLERLTCSEIVAAEGLASDLKCLFYVPDNTADLVVPAWSRGDVNKSVKRTEKIIRPTCIPGEAVHYLFPLPEEGCPQFNVLSAAARSITHLGWGIDMVAGNATIVTEVEAAELSGERWQPSEVSSAHGLRVPCAGTLSDLAARHSAFLNRLSADGFKPVPPLSAFRVVAYRKANDPVPTLRYNAFRIISSNPDAKTPSFDTPRKTRELAGMLRAATAATAGRLRPFGWDEAGINRFVHGKTSDGGRPASGLASADRFHYLPVPTINPKRVESIRRVLIAAPVHCRRQIEWAEQALEGQELVSDDRRIVGLLTALPHSDWVLKQYIAQSRCWSTVTPVILPRHDRNIDSNTEALLKLAFRQAGYSAELLSRTVIEWRKVGYRPGVDLASRYVPPKNLDHRPRYHVLVWFPWPVTGPLVVGAGRFRGFGLMAACGSQ